MSNKINAIGFKDLSVSVNKCMKSPKSILKQLNGCFDFGTITGLMGASGSGKTTLIKCLNASTKYVITDDSRVYCSESQPIVKRFISQDQNDRLIDGLTVGEALSYSSKVNNSNYKGVKHEENITQLMTQLLINDINDTTIEKCSGGQRKRIAIALQLTSIEKPNLLFMDEPTTGLDSNAAFELMKCLQILSKTHNIAIIVSIHQPNNDLFKMFDNIYVLAKGGHTIYDGSPQQMKHYLTDCGIDLNENEVPIEVMLKISSEGINSSNAIKLLEKVKQINENKNLDFFNHMKQLPNGCIQSTHKSFNFSDFWYIFERSLKLTFCRQSTKLLKQLLLFALINIFYGSVFNERISEVTGCLNDDTNQTCIEWQSDKSILTQSLNYIEFSRVISFAIHLAIMTTSFSSEFIIFNTEYKNNWYGSGVYFWSRFIVDCLITVIYSTIQMSIVLYYYQPMITVNNYFWLLAAILLTLLCNQTIGSMIGIIFSKNNIIAFTLSMFILSLFMTFDSYIISYDDMSYLYQIISDISYFSYTFKMTLIAMYGWDRKSTTILNNISGSIESQSLTAIMGPSGAGKTTLLKCLTANYGNHLSDNSFIGLTVKQTLLYASKLKNSRIVGQLDHNKIVNDLMSEFLISDIADNCVTNCSGGERKRIVIASELTSQIKPNLLIIDEPTSGLDSNAAINIIHCLRSLSRNHYMTIIVSIHQPNNELFNIFDNIYVLAKGGHAIYEGSPQNLKQIMIENNIDFKDNEVPIEVLLKIASEVNDNEIVLNLSAKHKSKQNTLKHIIIDENLKTSDHTNQFLTKRFSIKDLYTLLKRFMWYSYITNCMISVVLLVVIKLLTKSEMKY
ncbi:ATP-binding cassette sub-family G member 1-like [Oppia nitens]|uniref:ATP-binding cassette sub-family G member 1-like n=1 Tax=Oppia nitens TaxID=1686743 RepID=UPI0023DCBA4B|nr:ATP-binding cassette sub-family G member 1-like [Oppia nitens]